MSTLVVEHIPVDPIGNRTHWLALRSACVTASDVPAVCGYGAYGRTPLAVYAEKKGLVPAAEENNLMRRGRWFEPAATMALREEKPDWEIRPAKVFLVDRARRLGATPDCVVSDPNRQGLGVIQFKVVSRPIFQREWRVDPDGHEPDEIAPARVPGGYQLQTLTETMLADTVPGEPQAWCAVGALVVDAFDAFFRLLPVARHKPAEDRILESVAAWWRATDAGVAPPMNATEDGELLKKLYPSDDGTEIALHADMIAIADRLNLIKSDVKTLSVDIETCSNLLKGALGSHTYGRLPDGRIVSWKLQHRDSYVAKASDFRVLRIAKAKA